MASFSELSASSVESVLLHGDLHQGNILSAEREPWLAIDPKGVVGEPICETGPLLLNKLPPRLDSAQTRRLLARRVDQLAEELGVDRDRLRAWGVIRAVMSAFWSLEDHGRGWERTLVCAKLLESRTPSVA
ncbi:MAG TPA: aminoglycoside phosphotransferase family protein [Chloroflexota bacterium]|nr:aminoglycoside phosphotransferase family protein [Chloroflexota bacterium]